MSRGHQKRGEKIKKELVFPPKCVYNIVYPFFLLSLHLVLFNFGSRDKTSILSYWRNPIVSP